MRLSTPALVLLLAATPAAVAQNDTLDVRPLTDGIGGSLLLTNHGFGIGGLFRTGIGESTSLVLEASLGVGKDEREQEFFSGPFGETVTPFKRNNFLMLPLTIGLEQRLWSAAIADDFRPFVQLAVGPVVGYQWPYFEDFNENGIRDPGEPLRGTFDLRDGSFRFGSAGIAGFGAYFGEAGERTIGLRIAYAVQYFLQPVDLLEPRPQIEEPSRQFFATPVITLHLLNL
jgi:hypothetical protein